MPRVRHGFWTLHQADSADSDSGRYFSGAAKGEWCQPENVDRFFIIFHVFNFWKVKHSFSLFFCFFLSDFHQVFSQPFSNEAVKLWKSVKICEAVAGCQFCGGPACPTKWRRPSSSTQLRLSFDSVDHICFLVGIHIIHIQDIQTTAATFNFFNLSNVIYHLHIQLIHIYIPHPWIKTSRLNQDTQVLLSTFRYWIMDNLETRNSSDFTNFCNAHISRCNCRLIEVPWARHLWRMLQIWSLKGSKRHKYVGNVGNVGNVGIKWNKSDIFNQHWRILFKFFTTCWHITVQCMGAAGKTGRFDAMGCQTLRLLAHVFFFDLFPFCIFYSRIRSDLSD